MTNSLIEVITSTSEVMDLYILLVIASLMYLLGLFSYFIVTEYNKNKKRKRI